MRADIVTARAAVAHAAWEGRTDVTREDIRTAAKLALPHRRRRAPFDAPGLDEDLLDRLLGDDEPPPPEDPQDPQDEDPQARRAGPARAPEGAFRRDGHRGRRLGRPHDDAVGPQDSDEGAGRPRSALRPTPPDPTDTESGEDVSETDLPAPVQGVAAAHEPYRIRRLSVRGTGSGAAGKRSRAITTWGRTVGSSRERTGRVHLTATITAAARERGARATGTTGTTGTTGRADWRSGRATSARRSPRARSPTSCCCSSTPPGRWLPGRGWPRSRRPSCRCSWTPTSDAIAWAW
jgi:magnesium chelatase subunit D